MPRTAVTTRIPALVLLVALLFAVVQRLDSGHADAAVVYESLGQQPGGRTYGLAVAGRYGVPANAKAVTIDIGVRNAKAKGNVIVHPCAVDGPRPIALSYTTQGTANAIVTTAIGPNGGVCIYLSAEAELLFDRDTIVAVDPAAPAPATPTTAPTTTAPATTAPTTAPATTAPTTVAPAPAPAAPAPAAPVGVGTTVGSQSYPVPSGAVVVAPNGNDSNAGSSSAPLKTVARALAVVPSGGTIVLRGGVYSESLTITKKVTIQNWPGEAAWFDGARSLGGWVADGDDWRVDGWTTEFDTSPTFTRGAADGSAEYWTFINASYPLAAHPDQLWVAGTAMRQVKTRGEVVPGTFFHDRPGNRLYVGSNPSGKSVEASTLVKAIAVRADGVVIRGVGIRRFAPSVPDMGAVSLERGNATIEHVAITDSSTIGISVLAANAKLTNVVAARNGMMGIQANFADGMTVSNTLVEGNNSERFNPTPAAGGSKITKSRVVTIKNSIFRNNLASALWFDQSSYDIKVLGSEFRNNNGHGVFVEISNKAVIADNVIQGNTGFGIKYNNTSNGRIWNNTIVGNDRSLNIVQDNRRYGDGSSGVDSRYPNDPGMTWVNGPVEIRNNIAGNQKAGNCVLCVEDYSKKYSAEQMKISANGNVLNRPSASSPTWLVVWSGGSQPKIFNTLAQFRSATGQEASGVEVTGAAVVDANGVPTASMPSANSAVPLPSDIASLIGQPTSTRRLGAF